MSQEDHHSWPEKFVHVAHDQDVSSIGVSRGIHQTGKDCIEESISEIIFMIPYSRALNVVFHDVIDNHVMEVSKAVPMLSKVKRLRPSSESGWRLDDDEIIHVM